MTLALAASAATLVERSMLAFGLWVALAALHTALGLSRPHDAAPRPRQLLRGGAIAAGVLLLAGTPAFSDDVFRYLLDGRIAAAGLHPFSYAPDSPKIADVVATLPGAVNHPHLPTIYPAGAQLLFAAVGLVGGGTLVWRLLLVALVAPAAFALARQPDVGALPRDVAVVGHPLLLLSLCSDGHVDALAIPIGVALLAALRRATDDTHGARASARAGLWIGAGASIKLFPIAWPAALLGALGARRAVLAGVVATLALGLLYAPLSTIGPKTFGSLGTYAETWRYNAGPEALVSHVAERALAARGVAETFEDVRATERNRTRGEVRLIHGEPTHAAYVSRKERAATLARAFAAASLLLAMLWAWWRRWDAERALYVFLMTLFLTAPVIHPWYLLWLLPFSLDPRRRAGWVWCGSVVLAFYAPAWEAASGVWHDALAPRIVEYGVLFGVLVFDRATSAHLGSRESSR